MRSDQVLVAPAPAVDGSGAGCHAPAVSETVEVVVIGAGPAGLAVGACLGRSAIPAAILERADAVAPAWRRHYERLHLHTVKQHSALPMMPWPGSVPTYPSRAQVVEYLDAYAQAFGLRPRFAQEVRSIAREGDGWHVRTADSALRCDSVVVATGYNRRPHRPSWPGQGTFTGTIVHSSEYGSGAAWAGRRALVVGIGNSGAEIALDLWEHGARPDIAVRSPVHVVPRDLLGMPAQITGLLLSRLPPRIADRISLAILDRTVGDLSPWGLRRPDIGPVSQVIERGRVPVLDVGTLELIKQGKIGVVPEPRRFTEDAVVFVDDQERPYDVVVLATGYRTGLEDLLDDAGDCLDGRGYPRSHGPEAPTPGLYFIGFRNPPTGQLRDIAIEARGICDSIDARRRG